jgi:DNA-binding transcriptional MerR regulator
MNKYDRTISKDIVWVDDDPKMHSIGPDQQDVYTIGELSREFDVSLRALRFYESKALLRPCRDGQSRVYSAHDRACLALVLQGRRLGFTLGEIHDMIAISEGRTGNGSLNLTREKCFEQISLLERQKREVEAALVELRRIYSSFYASAAKNDIQTQ